MDTIELFRKEVYEPLGALLETEGDEGFITKGPDIVKAFYTEHQELLEALSTKHAEEGYTRKKVICDDGKHAARCMEWAPGACSAIHEHGARPCFDILLEGGLTIVDYRPQKIDGKKDIYELEEIRRYDVGVGEFVIVNPFTDESEVHTVINHGARSKSLHFYPIDHRSFGVYKETNRVGEWKRFEYEAPDD